MKLGISDSGIKRIAQIEQGSLSDTPSNAQDAAWSAAREVRQVADAAVDAAKDAAWGVKGDDEAVAVESVWRAAQAAWEAQMTRISDKALHRLSQLFRGIPSKEEMQTQNYVNNKLSSFSLENIKEASAEALSQLGGYLDDIEYYEWNSNAKIPDGVYDALSQACDNLDKVVTILSGLPEGEDSE